jgi:hypothetical protein
MATDECYRDTLRKDYVVFSKDTITPKTEIGRKLLKCRGKALTKGMSLRSADEINGGA